MAEADPRAEFQALLETYNAEHQPGTPTESFLVREMAQAHWKLRRTQQAEADILCDPLRVFDPALSKLSRYAASVRRDYYRAHRELRAIRAAQTRPAAALPRHKPAFETVGAQSRPHSKSDESNPPDAAPSLAGPHTRPPNQQHSRGLENHVPAPRRAPSAGGSDGPFARSGPPVGARVPQ
jgi:hypothetical protein